MKYCDVNDVTLAGMLLTLTRVSNAHIGVHVLYVYIFNESPL